MSELWQDCSSPTLKQKSRNWTQPTNCVSNLLVSFLFIRLWSCRRWRGWDVEMTTLSKSNNLTRVVISKVIFSSFPPSSSHLKQDHRNIASINVIVGLQYYCSSLRLFSYSVGYWISLPLSICQSSSPGHLNVLVILRILVTHCMIIIYKICHIMSFFYYNPYIWCSPVFTNDNTSTFLNVQFSCRREVNSLMQ